MFVKQSCITLICDMDGLDSIYSIYDCIKYVTE